MSLTRIAPQAGTIGATGPSGPIGVTGPSGPVAVAIGASKTSSSTRVNTVTATAETQLALALPAAGTYLVQYDVVWGAGASSSSGGRVGFSYTGTTTSVNVFLAHMEQSIGTIVYSQTAMNSVTTFAVNPNTNTYGRYSMGLVVATAGTLNFNWAQNTASSIATSLTVASSALANKIA